MNDSLQALMREATRLTQSGQLNEATAAIQRALGGSSAANPLFTPPAWPTADAALVLDGYVTERAGTDRVVEPGVDPTSKPAHADAEAGADVFIAGAHTGPAGTRGYKLYIPPAPAAEAPARALIVMLHGCTQDPDDFAAGTRMNALARQRGFYVLYPAQSQGANNSRCWNWFKHNHQGRGRGEPELLAGMTRAVVQQHGIDAKRVYAAGLSAGAAMAAILGEAYPDVYAAVGLHSGLPVGSAHDVPSAFAAMQSGTATPRPARPGRASRPTMPPSTGKRLPTIVFHGDQDATVNPRNGERLFAAAPGGEALRQADAARQGRRCTLSVRSAADGRTVAEHWLVHGAGHAWSGGDSHGSYADPLGPDASAEMLRFFMQHERAG